ncbi:serine hydrolase domain-containing protein, partial [Staphylococcus aureus]|nr:serine hydrolase domain-containing protein [Staphylococcus aureus]
VKNGKVFLNKGYGYQDVDKKVKASPTTKYEIASNTKAFTGLAILKLAQEGRLNLNDAVSKHVPHFKMNYNGQNETITIKQLLAQTSGIPSDITSEDSVTSKRNQLTDVASAIMGDELHHKPGEEFEYSNMNYDLLGLIIQNVTKQSYTQYITDHWLKPLQMKHTTFKQTNYKSKHDAIGYELQGSTPVVSKPEFNLWDTPSAYMMTSTEDLEHWIKFQLNPPDKYKSLVQQSHKNLSSTIGEPNANAYASGWFTNNDEHLVFHSGTLDNFSSFILLNPKQNYGIVVLANLNSEYVPKLVEHLNTQIVNNTHYTTVASTLNHYKGQFNIVTVLMTTLILLAFIFSAYRAWQMRHGQILLRRSKRIAVLSWLSLCICIALALALYALPYLILGSNNWSFVLTWLPIEIKLALITTLIALFSTLIVILLFLHTKITKT